MIAPLQRSPSRLGAPSLFAFCQLPLRLGKSAGGSRIGGGVLGSIGTRTLPGCASVDAAANLKSYAMPPVMCQCSAQEPRSTVTGVLARVLRSSATVLLHHDGWTV